MKNLIVCMFAIIFCLSSCKNRPQGPSSSSDISSISSTAQTDNSSSVQQTSSSASSTSKAVSSTASSSKVSSQSSGSGTTSSVDIEGGAGVIAAQVSQTKMTQGMFTRSVVQEGNLSRIAKVMKKAGNGEPVTIAVLGGSITEGAKATTPAKSYSGIIKTWWETAFPTSRLTLVNAGIGSTGSLIGVHRIAADVLAKNPDLVIVEYAVNDTVDYTSKETYENVVRRILKSSKNTAVLLLFTVKQDGSNMQEAEIQVGKQYNLPMISYKNAVWQELTIQKFLWTDIAADSVHPNDKGHAILGTLVNNFLQQTLVKLDQISITDDSLPAPLTSDSYENALLLTNTNLTPTSLGGFSKVSNAYYSFPNGWVVNGSTDPIVFQVTGKTLYLMYKMDTSGSGGKVSVKVDGAVVNTIDSDFTGGWGDNAVTYQILNGGSSGTHTVEIQLQPSDTKNKFTILGILQS